MGIIALLSRETGGDANQGACQDRARNQNMGPRDSSHGTT